MITRMRRRLSLPRDRGFTLIELVMAIVILGLITVPLANFMLEYIDNAQQSQDTMADSADLQIVTAYLSQDVANIGVRNGVTTPANSVPTATFQQSVWTTGFTSSCGSSITGGTIVLQLASQDAGSSGTPGVVNYIAYVKSGTTLVRVACPAAPGSVSSSTVVTGLSAVGVACSTDCNSPSSPPNTVSLHLSIQASSADQNAISNFTVTGQRRQT